MGFESLALIMPQMGLMTARGSARSLPRLGFALNRLLELATPLADAVSCAHRAGITHRDLKPDNVMIDRDGRLRVLDFGLAKLHDASGLGEKTQAATATVVTEEGKILGTVAYMSPEQAEGKTVDARSDVFSLGTMLYEMASGERPFRGETSMLTIGSILGVVGLGIGVLIGALISPSGGPRTRQNLAGFALPLRKARGKPEGRARAGSWRGTGRCCRNHSRPC